MNQPDAPPAKGVGFNFNALFDDLLQEDEK
jgi:hypothetical protein